MKMQLALTAAAMLLAAIVHAQTPSARDSAGAPSAASPYRSAFESYRPFQEEPVASWREVNETVERVGGHAGVLRAETAGAPAAVPPTPARPAAPVAAPNSMKDAHGQHHK